MIVQAVVATDLAGVIGINGGIPWHVPEDLKAFKRITEGSFLLMGTKTFESLPNVLPGRQHIVLSSKFKCGIYGSPDSPVVWHCDNLNFALTFLRSAGAPVASIIGGEELFDSALTYLDKAYITTIHTVTDLADARDIRYFPFAKLFEMSGVLHKEFPVLESSTGMRYSNSVWTKK